MLIFLGLGDVTGVEEGVSFAELTEGGRRRGDLGLESDALLCLRNAESARMVVHLISRNFSSIVRNVKSHPVEDNLLLSVRRARSKSLPSTSRPSTASNTSPTYVMVCYVIDYVMLCHVMLCY